MRNGTTEAMWEYLVGNDIAGRLELLYDLVASHTPTYFLPNAERVVSRITPKLLGRTS